MPRPRKYRKVCCLPGSNMFGPLNAKKLNDEVIIMSVEEYETIRLIDLEGFTQEDSAQQMKIARTTVQRIYNDARKKIAKALVNGEVIKIEGGDYELCDSFEKECHCGGCKRHRRTKDCREFDNRSE